MRPTFVSKKNLTVYVVVMDTIPYTSYMVETR